MSTPFDPYHKWLGISPNERPISCYQLLAIPLFEDDPEVIESAADRQMAHLKTYNTGKYASLAEQLLNEVSAAKLCLLNSQRKAAYDAQLKHQQARALQPSPAQPLPAQPQQPVQVGAGNPGLIPSPARPLSGAEAEPAEHRNANLPIIAGSVGGCLLIAILAGYLIFSPTEPDDPTAENNGENETSDTASLETNPPSIQPPKSDVPRREDPPILPEPEPPTLFNPPSRQTPDEDPITVPISETQAPSVVVPIADALDSGKPVVVSAPEPSPASIPSWSRGVVLAMSFDPSTRSQQADGLRVEDLSGVGNAGTVRGATFG
ncbi:MAG: hypothetical protein N2C14_08890, partial [Planctomycetales bacterium]